MIKEDHEGTLMILILQSRRRSFKL